MSDDDAQQKRNIFQYQGKPVTFFLDPSIKKASQREKLIRDIVDHGGKVLDVELGADTVLVDEKISTRDLRSQQLGYSLDRDAEFRRKVVEPMRFVQNCIKRGQFFHGVVPQQPMGGFVGRFRTNFTEEDDDNLCWYLSRTLPNPANGGRLSHIVYKELMAAAEDQERLRWALRHTDQSWRERYKKNRERFDPIIHEYTLRLPPEPPALYGLNRRRNKRPRRALKNAETDDGEVIEISDDSEYESEEESDFHPKSRKFSKVKARPSKRRRIDSSDIPPSAYNTPRRESHFQSSSPDHTHVGSSPRAKGKGKEVDRRATEPRDRRHPVREPSSPEPGPSQSRRPVRSPARTQSQRNIHQTPAPTATLVQQTSPITIIPATTPSANRSPNLTIPSTSFHNVVHSSPNFVTSPLTNRTGVKSGNTSITDPSSRSVVVPIELAPLPSGDTSNAPAESSITRESSHKRSSPIPLPLRKAVRKLPSRRPPVFDEDEGQKVGWAPYRNTRSRSRSVEPVALPVVKGRGRKGKIMKNDVPLDPVHEGEPEPEQEYELENIREDAQHVYGETRQLEENTERGNGVISVPLTESMQDERNVADLLIPHPSDASGIAGVASRGSVEDNEQSDEGSYADDETEDEGEGERLVIRRREEEEEEEEEEVGESGEEIRDNQEPKMREQKGSLIEQEDEESDSDTPLSGESDNEVSQKFSDPRRDLRRQHQPSLESDDAQTNRMIATPSTTYNTPGKSAQEVLALFDSSPETGPSPRQRKPFNSYRSGSPSPRHQNRPRESLPVLKSTQMRLFPGENEKVTSAQMVQRLTDPRRVSFSPLSPPSARTLPKPVVFIAHSPRSQIRSSQRQSPPSQSRSQRSRRASVESSSSDLVSFPISGTRASAVKQSMEQELKESPYTPPSGTKAARIVAARRNLRPRSVRGNNQPRSNQLGAPAPIKKRRRP